MAVDVKSLRIGSHLEYDGKRVCVDEIRTLRPDGEPMRLLVSHNGLVYGNPSIDEVEPIPITSTLLKELGFRKEDGFMRLWSKGDNGHFSYIEFSAIRDKWRLYPSGTDGSQTVVRYLHEAEAFLELYNIELIKE